MLLSELLNAQAVNPRLGATTKGEVIVELVELLESAHGVQSHGEILDRVLKREAMMSTGIGNGVAIPHGKAKAVDRLIAACGVSPDGVEFEAVDGAAAHLFILLVSPESVGAPHVKVLANISRLSKEDSVRQRLRSAASAADFLTALHDAEKKYL